MCILAVFFKTEHRKNVLVLNKISFSYLENSLVWKELHIHEDRWSSVVYHIQNKLVRNNIPTFSSHTSGTRLHFGKHWLKKQKGNGIVWLYQKLTSPSFPTLLPLPDLNLVQMSTFDKYIQKGNVPKSKVMESLVWKNHEGFN